MEWHEKYPFMCSDDGTLPEDSALYKWGANFFEASTFSCAFIPPLSPEVLYSDPESILIGVESTRHSIWSRCEITQESERLDGRRWVHRR